MKCEEAVAIYMQSHHDPYNVDASKNNRLWGHDFLHSFFHTSPATGIGEEKAAIHQAVILRDLEVNEKPVKKWADGGQQVGFLQIRDNLLPDMARFRAKMTGKPANEVAVILNDSQIIAEMTKAKRFEVSCHQLFGKRLGEIPIEDLKEMDYAVFLDIMKNIERASLRR